jgi:hypothetical protein
MILVHSVCPSIVRTNIFDKKSEMFAVAEKHNLFTPIEKVVDAVESFLGASEVSGTLSCRPPITNIAVFSC